MTLPKVSIVIAAYNRPDVLRWAIRSVLAQTYDVWELLLILDHADAETVAVAREFNDLRIHIINLPVNFGEQTGPNNVGIGLATGQYVAFLSHDDMWLADHLETLVFTALGRNAQVVLSQAFGIYPMAGETPKFDDLNTYLITRTIDGRYVPQYSFCGVSNWLVATDVFARIGGFKSALERYLDSTSDLICRFVRAGGHPVFAPQATTVALHSGIRPNSYHRANEREHNLIGPWLLTSPPSEARALLIQRLTPLENQGWRRLVGRMGLPLRLFELRGLHGFRRGAMINALRRTRGLNPIVRDDITAARIKLTNDLILKNVQLGETYRTSGNSPHQVICFDGWHRAESWGTWAASKRASLRWRWADEPPAQYRVRLDAVIHPSAFGRQHVTVRAGRKTVFSRWVKPTDPAPYSFDFLVHDGGREAELVLTSTAASSAKSLGRGEDVRRLSWGLSAITLDPVR